ncbi:MAG: hypothetical protein P1P86_10585 [Bacteroidales bacterium]|nr:hypothetical protein [Bacteroidales bacterium]
MKLIKPSEISAKILTLLDESNERVILVSPYMKISKWYKLLHKINRLKKRRILTEIYVREDPDNTATYRDLDQLTLQYIKIPHLHSKLYMNEKYGIVTSMNLLLSSEINSLEIGYLTETQTEYKELLHYYQRYICSKLQVHNDTFAGQSAADLKEMMYNIREKLKETGINSWLWFAENTLHICTGRNNYKVMLNDGHLRITACLSTVPGVKQQSIQRSLLILKKIGDLSAMKIEMHVGPQPDILQLSGQAQYALKSTCITGILETESVYLMESVVRFIDALDDQK